MQGFEFTVWLMQNQQACDATATLFVQLRQEPIERSMVLRHRTIRMLLTLLTATQMDRLFVC